jgi:hypothetical protein
MLGIVPFEHLLEEGLGARLYVASREGEHAASCPFCEHPMQKAPDDLDGPPGLAVCHLCEQVWLPLGSADWIAEHSAQKRVGSPAAAQAPQPAQCEECGAPFAPDAEGHCPYCHAQLTKLEPVIVAMPTPAGTLDGMVGILGKLLGG